jgi:hypothetical protein
MNVFTTNIVNQKVIKIYVHITLVPEKKREGMGKAGSIQAFRFTMNSPP